MLNGAQGGRVGGRILMTRQGVRRHDNEGMRITKREGMEKRHERKCEGMEHCYSQRNTFELFARVRNSNFTSTSWYKYTGSAFKIARCLFVTSFTG